VLTQTKQVVSFKQAAFMISSSSMPKEYARQVPGYEGYRARRIPGQTG
jgi:hypothetical protein